MLALDYDVRSERPVRVSDLPTRCQPGQLDRAEARFAEYFEPFAAEPLGSLDQSWTAAIALDWLAERN